MPAAPAGRLPPACSTASSRRWPGPLPRGRRSPASDSSRAPAGRCPATTREPWPTCGAAVCAPGPGIIGSASRLGNGALAAADALNVAVAIGCEAVLVPRLSDGDPRDRHRGLSHHARTVAELTLGDVVAAWPAGRQPEELGALRLQEAHADLDGYAASGLPATTMGRGIEDDPAFFAAPLAAGAVLAGLARG